MVRHYADSLKLPEDKAAQELGMILALAMKKDGKEQERLEQRLMGLIPEPKEPEARPKA